MAIQKVLKIDNQILRQKSEVVTEHNFSGENIHDMRDTLLFYDGAGISAVQIGVLKKIFLANLNGKVTTFINPAIEWISEEKELEIEGCLSSLNIFTTVWRPREVIITYQDENLNPKDDRFSGFNARIIQHEFSHLSGKLFIDEISSTKREIIQDKIKKLKARGEWFKDHETIDLMRSLNSNVQDL